MTAKELLARRVPTLSEAQAARALLALDGAGVEAEHDDEMVALPEGWGETLTGEPMPNVVAAVRRSREEH